MIASFLGGLALFLYGQFLLESNIQKTSRLHLRAIVKLLTKHRFTSILVGSVLTVGMQSSTISVLTLVDLINLGILKLSTAIGMVLGAGIGTTIIVQAISFDVVGYALWFIIIGFIISRLSKYIRGELLIGLGFMFFGIYLMGRGVVLFKETSFGNSFLGSISASPIQNMIGAFILTVISQSTLAPMAVGITLVRDGGLGLVNAIPIILGSHIGAGILPLIYSWKVSGTTIGRQLGISNLIYRIIGVLVFLPLIGILAELSQLITQWFGASSSRQFANAHTLFTLATVGLFIPFTGSYIRLVKKIMPVKESHPVRKDIGMLRQEELRLAEEVYGILNDSIRLWEGDSLKEIDRIEKKCFSIRLLEEGILKYATEDKQCIKILETVSNLEKISEVIGSRLTELARKRITQGLNFSIEGLNEVLTIHRRIIDEFGVMLDRGELKEIDKEIESLISASFTGHINRMCKGFRETMETRLLHTDAITLLEHIHWHIQKMSEAGPRT